MLLARSWGVLSKLKLHCHFSSCVAYTNASQLSAIYSNSQIAT